MVIGTYREGARGVFALDVTQPDAMDPLNVLNFAGHPDIEWVPLTADGGARLLGHRGERGVRLRHADLSGDAVGVRRHLRVPGRLGVDFTAPATRTPTVSPTSASRGRRRTPDASR